MISHLDFQNVAIAISAYAQERWTKARLINSTGLVTSSSDVDTSGESFTGQMRWYKPLSAVVNDASLVDPTAGSYTPIATDIASYIKSVRAVGAQQINLQNVVSRQDGLAFFAGNFARERANDENSAILAALQGVAATEAARGTGIVDFDTMPGVTTGAYVDVNAAGSFGGAATGAADARKLVDAAESGARQGERIFRAMGMFWKDYEPDYAYILTSPETLADFRSANLVDETKITDGNLEFQTLFGGKFRILLTRSSQGNYSSLANVNDQSTKTTFIVKAGAIAFHPIDIQVPTEVDRNAAAYLGGGTTNIWYRYGFVAHPLGYDWVGSTSQFASNTALAAGASWNRKFDPLNLGILPIFHS